MIFQLDVCSAWRSISRPLIYGWSDEELRLATGSKQVTQLQHQLKLYSAYFGVPVSCLLWITYVSMISLFLSWISYASMDLQALDFKLLLGFCNQGSRKTRDNIGEPLATSYHSQFMGTVDYIWYLSYILIIIVDFFEHAVLLIVLLNRHTGELLPVRVLETLPIDILKRSAGLPCEVLL